MIAIAILRNGELWPFVAESETSATRFVIGVLDDMLAEREDYFTPSSGGHEDFVRWRSSLSYGEKLSLVLGEFEGFQVKTLESDLIRDTVEEKLDEATEEG